MRNLARRICSPLALVPFLFAAFFSFAAMSYGPDGHMQGGCPFSAAKETTCPANAFAAALHHISSYQAFLAAPVGAGFSILLLSLLLALIGAALLRTSMPFAPVPAAPAVVRYRPPPVSSHTTVRTWLSFFEHSPPLF